MDFEDELDSLLDLEDGLLEELDVSGARKRGLLDARSLEETSESLGGAAKRSKTSGAGGGDSDDEALVQAALGLPQASQQTDQPGGNRSGLPPESEGDAELLALAMAMPDEPSARGLPAPPARPAASAADASSRAMPAPPQRGTAGAGPGEAMDLEAMMDLAGFARGSQQLAEAEPPAAAPRPYLPPARTAVQIPGAYLTVTCGDTGDRVYCKLDAAPVKETRAGGSLRPGAGRLLARGVMELLEEIDADSLRRALEQAEAEALAAGSPAGAGRQGAGDGPGSKLWVDKYAPKSFLDLLSDEQSNREVVRWLKQWDPCVFGLPAPGAGARPHAKASWPAKVQESGTAAHAPPPDPLGRPEHKIILLSGPPGLGKTTLAHVVARHCGYRTVEVNASDERVGSALASRVLDATEMRSVMGERRPNCVIIDEIDGVLGGPEGRSAVSALLKIVLAAPKAKQGGGHARKQQAAAGNDSGSDSDEEADQAGAGASTRPAGSAAAGGRAAGAARRTLRPLQRPIIAICNDLYAPALRPLRDVARVFQFKKPQAERLAQRLQAICAAEGLRAEKSTLRLLAERAECDVRSCLNTLQFLARRQRSVTSADLAGLQVGQKDLNKGAFVVWQELLQRKKQSGRRTETEGDIQARHLSLLADFGEAELVLSGLHDNLVGLKYPDVALGRTNQVLEALEAADRLLGGRRKGDYGAVKFAAAPMVAAAALAASHERPQLQWPRAGAECARRAASNRTLLRSWCLRMSPAVYSSVGQQALVLDVLPSLLRVLSPTLRPVSTSLYSPEEQASLSSLVDAMLAYGVRFCFDPAPPEEEEEEQQAGEGGWQRGRVARDLPLRLKPAVHQLCRLKGLPQAARSLPLAVRQAVHHQVEMEAIRRAEAARQAASGSAGSPGHGGGGAGAAQAAPRAGPRPLTVVQRFKEASAAAAAARGAAGSKAAKPASWLDRLREEKMARRGAGPGTAAGGAGGPKRTQHAMPVLYKYLEGYTNAVKRPVTVADLLR